MGPTDQLHIVIIGAGLGGLAAAIQCSLSRHKVTVLERAPELAVIGAGIQLTPNSTRIFDSWGLTPILEKCWAEVEHYTVRRYSDGSILYRDDGWGAMMRRKYGAPFVDVHRGELQMMMYQHALHLEVHVCLGEEVDKISHEDGQITTLAGKTYHGDLIVGADGLWSKCREALLGCQDDPMPTGDLAYRILLDMNDLDDPDVKEVILKPGNNIWIGPGGHAIGYPVKAGSLFNLVLLLPDDIPDGQRSQHGDLAEMADIFRDWDPRLSKILSKVKVVTKWKLMHREALPSWSNEKRNFVLLGDSCHPMLPYLAQGAASAIEDGAALGIVLGGAKTAAEVPGAIEKWESLRKPRGERIQRGAMEQRANFHMQNGPMQEERDRIMQAGGGKEAVVEGFPAKWADPEFQSWLFGYDTINEATAALKL